MSFDRELIDSHEQKYDYSCISSSVEMILKLLGKADKDFYKLQDFWKNEKITFAAYDGFKYKGVRFEQKFKEDRGPNFPLLNLFSTIDQELTEGKYVLVSLVKDWDAHIYVIHQKKNDEYLAFSKRYNETFENDHVKADILGINGTDILVYKT
jgi:hypothetical protein